MGTGIMETVALVIERYISPVYRKFSSDKMNLRVIGDWNDEPPAIRCLNAPLFCPGCTKRVAVECRARGKHSNAPN